MLVVKSVPIFIDGMKVPCSNIYNAALYHRYLLFLKAGLIVHNGFIGSVIYN